MWHQVAPRLAEDFTVVARRPARLWRLHRPRAGRRSRALLASARWPATRSRSCAELGFERFDVAGHDRGARVAYRLALDHPECVRRLAVLDIAADRRDVSPHRHAHGAGSVALVLPPAALRPARAPASPPTPRASISRGREHLFAPEALSEYRRCLRDPAVIHAICEDYRAGATIDYELDSADRGARRIGCPTLALWGADGPLARIDAAAIWQTWAADLQTAALPCGHHLPEEAPDATYDALHAFLA